MNPIRLGSGPGGYKIDQILDLWKGIALGGVGASIRGGGGSRAGGTAGSQGGGVAAGKTVNAVDWGVGSESIDCSGPRPKEIGSRRFEADESDFGRCVGSSKKVLTACSNGNLMVFDVEQGRLGKSGSITSLPHSPLPG